MTVANDLASGIVLHLDPITLEANGGGTSVAPAIKVQAHHFFVCLGRLDQGWRLLPCYSDDGPGRISVDASLKSGHPKWTTGTTYFHPAQVWVASATAIEAAALAGTDRSRPGRRNWLDVASMPGLP